MLILNDDCLLELMGYLSLGDIYNIGRTCRRLNNLVNRAYIRFSDLDAKHFLTSLDQLKTLGKMRTLVKEVAHHVVSFKICRKILSMNGLIKCRALIILILIYCPNITKLKVGFYIQDGRTLREISALANFRKLETINIRGNIKLKNFSQLKNLNLMVENNGMNMSKLLYLKNLHSLCLNLPTKLSANLFAKICDNNPGIKRINLNIMSDTLIKIVVSKLVHLEDFTLPPKSDKSRYTISGIQIISQIKSLTRFTASHSIPALLTQLAHLDQLESLTFTGSSSIDTYKIKYFSKLKYLKTTNLNGAQLNALKCQKILEHLDISDSNYVIDNDDIVNFVGGAIKLKYLAIRKCDGLDKNLLRMLSELMKMCTCKRRLTIVCDMVQKRDTKNYPYFNVVVEKSVRFS